MATRLYIQRHSSARGQIKNVYVQQKLVPIVEHVDSFRRDFPFFRRIEVDRCVVQLAGWVGGWEPARVKSANYDYFTAKPVLKVQK